MADNYIYIPESKGKNIPVKEHFRCRVPLSNTRQIFVIDGKEEKSGNEYELKLGRGEILPEIVQVIQVRSNEKAEDISYKTGFILGESSQARVLLCSHTLSMHNFITGENVNIKLEKNANLDMVVMQNEHNRSVHKSVFNVEMAASSVLNIHLITLHGGDISNKLEINLNGEHGECFINGLYLADGSQKVSTEVNVFHNVPRCRSNQLIKGILDGESVTQFNGKIYVAVDAQKTEAYQSNNNLLASETAKVYTRPHLEIYADDVKCSHGATIGSLNDMELFYMRSRGIPLQEARLLQKQAFAYTVLEKISNSELRERLYSLVERRLRGEFSHCSNCSMHCC